MPHVVNGASDLYVFGGAITAGACGDLVPRAVLPARSAASRCRAIRTAARGGAGRAARARRRCCSCPISWASAARSGTARRAAPSSASACSTRARISIAPCSRASPSRCATTSRRATRGAWRSTSASSSSAARRARISGCRSSPTSRAIRSGPSREDVEAALGAALLAALGIGLIGAEDRHDWITLVERARPDPAHTARYDAMFAAYTALYPALRDTMHQLAELRNAAPG